MGSGGGGGGAERPEEFQDAFAELGNRSEEVIEDTRTKQSFAERGDLGRLGGRLAGPSGRRTFANYGVAGFNRDNLRAQALTRGLRGNDPLVDQAGRAFANNQGINSLQRLNIGQQKGNSLASLSKFSPSALRGLDFQGLNRVGGLAGIQSLQDVSAGKNLAVDQNPFLKDALAAAQRQTTENFTQNVQPALASQFGGGFGLTGSASINAQRRAATDLNRDLGEQATQVYADQFARERQAQDAASQFLGGLDLNRAQGLAGLRLDRAGQIDQSRLSRAGQLGQLGLGFSGQQIQRGQALGQLGLEQAKGLGATGDLRRKQRFGQINALNQIGNQRRDFEEKLFQAQERRHNQPLDERIGRLQNIGSILGTNPVGAGGGAGAGPSKAAGALGGAATGASLGFTVGGPYGAAIGGIGGGALGYFAT